MQSTAHYRVALNRISFACITNSSTYSPIAAKTESRTLPPEAAIAIVRKDMAKATATKKVAPAKREGLASRKKPKPR
jgi:nickel-dependent lactate racemase